MTQAALDFDGPTFSRPRDQARLSGLLERVRELMTDGRWRTLHDIQEACGGTEASCSARLRDLRKTRFGGYVIERRHLDSGLWIYRMVQSSRVSEMGERP